MSCATPTIATLRVLGSVPRRATRAFRNTAVGTGNQIPANPRIPVKARSPRMLLWGSYFQSSIQAMLYFIETGAYPTPHPVPVRILEYFEVAMRPRFSALRAFVDESSCVVTLESERNGRKMGFCRPHPTTA